MNNANYIRLEDARAHPHSKSAWQRITSYLLSNQAHPYQSRIEYSSVEQELASISLAQNPLEAAPPPQPLSYLQQFRRFYYEQPVFVPDNPLVVLWRTLNTLIIVFYFFLIPVLLFYGFDVRLSLTPHPRSSTTRSASRPSPTSSSSASSSSSSTSQLASTWGTTPREWW